MGDPSHDAEPAIQRSQDLAPDTRLDSWKEIAAYLKRDVTTVRRWEKREGLPVLRHLHERRDSVYAYTREIDEWWRGRRNQLAQNESPDGLTRSGEFDQVTSSAVAKTPERSLIYRHAPLGWILAATVLVVTLALTAILTIRRPPVSPAEAAELRFSISPPDQSSFGAVSLSPDGRQLAFTATTYGGKTLLWVRPLDTLAARSLPDTEDASFPFWSPTSDALGFFAGGKVWLVEASGGMPRAVADAPSGRGGTWSRQGIIVFAPDREGPLLRVLATGGPTTPVTTVERPKERGHLWPEFLPDGDHFLYLADADVPEHHNLFVGALDGEERTALVPRASSNAVYDGNGYLLFARDRQLLAQPFDAIRLALTGEAVAIVDRVHQPSEFEHRTDVSVSANGVLMYRTMQSPATRLVWRDRTQQRSTLVSTPAEYTEPAVSPDESSVAIDVFDPVVSKRFGYGFGVRSDVWILNASTGAPSQFTSHPAADWGPVWSPDGRRIVFSSNRSGRLELYVRDATGAEGDELLLPSSGLNPVAQSWSPDGKFLVYSAFDPKMHMDLWLLPMSGNQTPLPLLRTEFSEDHGRISPDGRWFAYTSYESGRPEVYVQRFPALGVKSKISIAGGGDARWHREGKELFYIAADRRLMAVAVKTGAIFEHGPTVPLFDTSMPPYWYYARNLYDVTRDGRFLFMAPVEDDRSSPFTIVLNWKPHR